MTPSLGRIVAYTVTATDVQNVQRNREASGKQGNGLTTGEVVPMVIVKVWNENLVNGQVLLDGPDNLWVTSVSQGEDERQWHEFPRV